jgi:P pilus assembly chaperone PapD
MSDGYRLIMNQIPEVYKLKGKPKSLTEMQILACLKLFLEKDEETGKILK